MAFTVVSKANGGQYQGNWNSWSPTESPFFYVEDLVVLMNQPGVVALRVINANIGAQPDTNKQNTIALIGVIPGESLDTYISLDGPNDLMALGCSPYNIKGGVLEPTLHP